MRKGRRVNCACCGREGWHKAHGWVENCYRRWCLADQPADGPPAPLSLREVCRLGNAAQSARREENLEEFAMVLQTRSPITIGQAAKAVSVCHRTGVRYIKALREMGHPAVEYWERVTNP